MVPNRETGLLVRGTLERATKAKTRFQRLIFQEAFMKMKFGKLAVLGAVLAASTTFASADTIALGSFGTGDSAMGNNNTALNYAGYNAGSSPFNLSNPFSEIHTGTGSSFNLTGGSPWHSAISGSSWVSQNIQSGPGGNTTAANGYYTFTTTFSSAAGGAYVGSLSLLADDTVAVFLNGSSNPFVLAGAIGNDNQCSVGLPTCQTVDTVTWDPTLLSGTNTLTFVVEQTGNSYEGFDFDGSLTSVSATPEPNSLILLGTSLFGAAGMLVRKRRTV
jgi:hypothetical protein